MILTTNVRVQSTGLVRRAGKSVGTSEVPPSIWDKWVEEGILVDGSEKDLILAPKPEVESPPPALETELGRMKPSEISEESELPLAFYSQDRLRLMAKDQGVAGYWRMKKPRLIHELELLKEG